MRKFFKIFKNLDIYKGYIKKIEESQDLKNDLDKEF